jgi:chromosome segregation ATPase
MSHASHLMTQHLLQQVATLEASVAKAEKALVESKAKLAEEHAHRQDLQQRVVERDRKLATLETEIKGLVRDRKELQAEKDARLELMEGLHHQELHASAKQSQVEKKVQALELQVTHMTHIHMTHIHMTHIHMKTLSAQP